MDHLRRLVAHLSWADQRAHDALTAADPRARHTALDLYAHILGAEHVWLARLTGAEPRTGVWPRLTLIECEDVAREAHVALTGYVEALVPADLQRGVSYVNSAGEPFTSTVEDILLQIFLHGAYHRGQVALLLRQGEATPAPTDYIAYVRGAPAATRAVP
jgi:uncharacterized damage-inducible protein DinB